MGTHQLTSPTALLTLALITIAGCSGTPTEEHGSAPTKTVHARTVALSLEDTDQVFDATGTVRARLNSVLASKVLAKVTKVAAVEGDSVRQGQLLANLDARELDSAVDVAGASLLSARVGVGNAKTAAAMQEETSKAVIAEAEARVAESEAAIKAARSRLDLALAGPRQEERVQAKVAVDRALSSVTLTRTELDRAERLYESGAVARRDVDYAKNNYDLAKGQYDSAVQALRMTETGTRPEEIRSAREAVAQAEAARGQAVAGLARAKAASLENDVRREEVRAAQAQVNQSGAALRSAQVARSYATVTAPFDGRVVKRYVDPGSMAAPGSAVIEVEGGGLRLEAQVPEWVVGKIHVGQSVKVEIDALSDRAVTGTLVEIVPAGDATTHVFVAKVELGERPGLKSGMFGRVKFPVGRQERIMVPLTATWEREGLHYVFAVNKEGIARLRIITLGETIGDRVEALSGLAPGDRIVVDRKTDVKDGDKVQG